MRLLAGILLTSVLAGSAFGRTYTISTFAGSTPPVNILGTSAGLGGGLGDVAVDRAGNLYFIYQDSVLRLDATSHVLTLAAGNGSAGFSGDNGPATSAQLNSPGGLAVDSAGNLFIADSGDNCVRKVSNAAITTVAGNGTYGFSGDSGPANGAQLASPDGVAVDSNGNVYVADNGNNRIRKVSNGVITTVAGNGTGGFAGDGGPATSAQLNGPADIAVDAAGNLYIPDSGNDRVRKVSVSNGVITTLAGNGTYGFSGDNGPAASAELNSPEELAVDSAGNVYISDAGNNRIRRVSNGVITTIAGNGTAGFGGDNGLATSSELSLPEGVAVDSVGGVYIADIENSRVRKVSGGIITTIAGSGSSGDGGPATSAQLDQPSVVAADSAGNVYIADSGDNRVRKVSNGVISTIAGNGTAGFSGDNGPATSAELNYPEGVAADSVGNLFIADTGNNTIRKISNGVITTVAGNGTAGFGGDSGSAVNGQLDGPASVAVDSVGNLYIADYYNNRIRRVSNGVITTIAGNGTAGFSGDNGPAMSAALNAPEGVAVDPAGDLYIADAGNNRIRRVSNGVITTIAGNGTAGFSGDSGSAASAQLNFPNGVAVDSAGSLYLADADNGRVRKVSNGVISTVAGTGTQGLSGDGGPAISAQLDYPVGVAVNPSGSIYIADLGDSRVRLMTPVLPTVLDKVTSNVSGLSNGVCTTPPLLSTFTPASQSVWIYFDVNGAAVGDKVSISVYRPDGTLYTSFPIITLSSVGSNGYQCFSEDLALSGTQAASFAGIWSIRTSWNTTSLFTLSFTLAQSSQVAPTISNNGIVNAAGSPLPPAPVAPGSIVSIYGSNMASAPPGSGVSATTLPLPTTLGGAQVLMNGIKAPLYYADAGQINAQVPWEVSGASGLAVQVVYNGATSDTANVALAAAAPGVFAIVHAADYSLVTASKPAVAGEYLVVFCNGLGAVSNQPASGSAAQASPTSTTVAATAVTIGGAPASVVFSGLVPGLVGLYQVNVLVPSGVSAGSAVPLVISAGKASSNSVPLAVQSGTGITITSPSTAQAAALDTLIVNGTGFNPNAATSVLLMPGAGAMPISVPAVAVTTASVEIAVPPILNGSESAFVGGVMSVQVLQLDGTVLSTSNVIAGLQINPPSNPAAGAAGAITAAFLASGLNVSSSIQADAATNSGLTSLAGILAAYSSEANNLLSAINTVVNDPSQSVPLTSSNGVAFALDANTLALSDQLIAAYVSQFVSQVMNVSGQQPTANVSRVSDDLPFLPAAATSCPANEGIDSPAIQVGVCDVQQYSQNLASAGAQAVQLGAKIEGGFYLSFLGGWATGGLAEAGAISTTASKAVQLAWTFTVPYITAFATNSNPPPLYTPLGGVIAKILDSGIGGVGLLPATLKAYQAFTAASAISASNGGSGAMILTGSQTNAPSGSTVVNAFQYSNGTPSVTALAAPGNQHVINISNITVPAPPTPSFTLTVVIAGSGGGTVTPTPAGLSYPAGTSVTLVAKPNAQSTFASWGSSFGDCSGGNDTCLFTVHADEIITANFNATPQQFTLTTATSGTGSGTIGVSSSASGLNCGSGCLSFPAGTAVTLTATPNAGSTFAGWSGACSGTGACTVTLNANASVTATFNASSPGGAQLYTYVGSFKSVNTVTTNESGCTPQVEQDELVASSAQLTVTNLSAPGVISGVLTIGPITETDTIATWACTFAGHTTTYPGSTTTSPGSPSSQLTVTGVSDGSTISFPQNPTFLCFFGLSDDGYSLNCTSTGTVSGSAATLGASWSLTFTDPDSGNTINVAGSTAIPLTKR